MRSLTFTPAKGRTASTRLEALACETRGCSCCAPTSIATLPNALTITRTIACAALAVGAVGCQSWTSLLAAVAAYWVGDVSDGIVARATGRETRFGAALDVVCDRACCALVMLGVVALEPSFAIPVAVYALGIKSYSPLVRHDGPTLLGIGLRRLAGTGGRRRLPCCPRPRPPRRASRD
jgi:CDP-alcohol phosphatidyltransferase